MKSTLDNKKSWRAIRRARLKELKKDSLVSKLLQIVEISKECNNLSIAMTNEAVYDFVQDLRKAKGAKVWMPLENIELDFVKLNKMVHETYSKYYSCAWARFRHWQETGGVLIRKANIADIHQRIFATSEKQGLK